MTYGHLQADCLYTGISSGPNARYRVWKSLYLYLLLLLLSLACQEAPVASRSLSRSIGSVTLLAAYCNIFLNPLIYILLYDVVKRSLTSLVQALTARVINQQQQQPVAN